MNDETVKSKLIKIAGHIFDVNADALSLNSSRDSIPEWDSLAHLKLFLEIEDEFEMSFSLDNIKNLKSLNDIYQELINQKQL